MQAHTLGVWECPQCIHLSLTLLHVQAAWRGYSTASAVSEHKWFVNGASVYRDGNQIRKDLVIDGKHLGELGKNAVIRVAIDQEGIMWMAFSETGDRVQVRVLCDCLVLLLNESSWLCTCAVMTKVEFRRMW